MSTAEVEIRSRDYWIKVVGMLQQNWALVVEGPLKGVEVIYFLSDTSYVFDRIVLDSTTDARPSLLKNGFRRYDEDPRLLDLTSPPQPPFFEGPHPNGRIYSSGRYWAEACLPMKARD